MRNFALAFALATLPVLAAPALADPPAEQRAEAQQVVLTGENLCLGCALKKSDGAAAQCSLYGHRHGLRVESARAADGSALADLAGQTVHYLDNDQSAALVKGESTHGQKVEVTGRLFAAEHVIEVASFKAVE